MKIKPLSNYANYLKAVRVALDQQPAEWSFKSDPGYREVLEHTPVEFAEAMRTWSMQALPGLNVDHVRSLCWLNDSIGKPVQAQIAELGTFAPSNMRYLCHAIKVWKHIDTLRLSRVNVVEIGGGYGGLAFWIRGICHYFRTDVARYAMFDLRDVSKLQQKVLAALEVDAFALDGTRSDTRWETFGTPSFGVSMYAFSEFDQATRDWYAERVLKQCGHGLMVWNFPQAQEGADGRWFGGPPYQFVDWPITRVPDAPALYDGHEMVTW